MRIWTLLISLLEETGETSANRRIEPSHGVRLRIWGKEHVHVSPKRLAPIDKAWY